jgi:lysophospholipase L1-like esterase
MFGIGLTFSSMQRAGSGGGGGPTLGAIASERCVIPNGVANRTAPYTARRSLWAHPDGDISNIRVSYTQAYLLLTGDTVSFSGAGGALQIKAYLEYPANTFTPILFAGVLNASAADGTTITSDPVAITIPAGAQFWVRTVLRVTANIAAVQSPALVSALANGDTAENADLGNSGNVTQTSFSFLLAPSLITADIDAANAKSAVIIGDSIAWGEGDITSSGSNGSSGYVARGLATRFPYAQISKQSMKASEFDAFGNAGWLQIMALINAASPTHLVSEYGFNDLRIARTPAQLSGNLASIYNKFPTATAYQATITPRSTSTDGWITTINQTPYAVNDFSNQVTAMNAIIRAVGITNQDAYFEPADIAMTARDSNIWKAPPASTLDGAHPTSAMAASISASLSTVT